MLNILFMVDEIFTGKTKMVKKDHKDIFEIFDENKTNTAIQRASKQPNKQPKTTEMPDLESEESAGQRINHPG